VLKINNGGYEHKCVTLKYCYIKFIDVPLCVVIRIEKSGIEVIAPKE